MIAVDTNVVVRLLTDDDAKQVAAARTLLESEKIWIAKTVLLETAWVLKTLYGFDDRAIGQPFRKLSDLRNVELEDASAILVALDLTEFGLEFADAFHLGSQPTGTEFVSFDRKFVKRAKRAGVAKIDAM